MKRICRFGTYFAELEAPAYYMIRGGLVFLLACEGLFAGEIHTVRGYLARRALMEALPNFAVSLLLILAFGFVFDKALKEIKERKNK